MEQQQKDHEEMMRSHAGEKAAAQAATIAQFEARKQKSANSYGTIYNCSHYSFTQKGNKNPIATPSPNNSYYPYR